MLARGEPVSKSLAGAWAAAWNAHDVDAVVAWYAADGSHHMASGSTYTGAPELRAMVERTLHASPDLGFDVRDAFAVDDHFAIEYTMRGTRDGRRIEIDGALVGTLDHDARVRTCVDYLDHLSIRRQLGLAD